MTEPDWPTRHRERVEEEHFDRASDLAQLLDTVAGSDETRVALLFTDLVRSAPPGARQIVLRLLKDADALRCATRTQH